jgi:CheY-like chemotaxis protein
MSAKRILVVDDEPSVRESIQIMLDGQGHQIDFVTSGAEALDRRPTENYDLTVTDYRMTGMTGLDLAKELTRRRPGHTVILMSGSPPMDSGGFCDAVLLKPFSVSDLREAVVSPPGDILIQIH